MSAFIEVDCGADIKTAGKALFKHFKNFNSTLFLLSDNLSKFSTLLRSLGIREGWLRIFLRFFFIELMFLRNSSVLRNRECYGLELEYLKSNQRESLE